MKLQGKTVLVTGASRGLGFASAEVFAREGAHVIALARTVGGLEELDDRIQKAGGSATLVPLDLLDQEGLARMCAAIHGRWGKLDIWFHTAAHAPPLSPLASVDMKDVDKTIALNIRCFQNLIRMLDPLLRQSDAPIAMIASDNHHGEKFFGTYEASKAAQLSLASAWAAESQAKLRVIAVEPPPMPTAVRARFFPGEDRATLVPPSAVAEHVMGIATDGGTPPGFLETRSIQLVPAT